MDDPVATARGSDTEVAVLTRCGGMIDGWLGLNDLLQGRLSLQPILKRCMDERGEERVGC